MLPGPRVLQRLAAGLLRGRGSPPPPPTHVGSHTLAKAMFAGKTLATTSKLAPPWIPHSGSCVPGSLIKQFPHVPRAEGLAGTENPPAPGTA